MGGTLTKELLGLAGVSTCRLARVSSGVGAGGGGTSRVGLGGLSSTLLGPQVTGHRLVGCLVRAGPWTTNRFVCALV